MKKIGFWCCNAFITELQHVIESCELKNISVKIAPGGCSATPQKDSGEIEKKFKDLYSDVDFVNVMTASVCRKCYSENFETEKSRHLSYDICLEWVAAPEFIAWLIKSNYYITTPGWIKSWETTVIEKWKFNKETAEMFFAESAKEILLLDTKVYEDSYLEKLKSFSDFVKLPYKIIPVGIDYFKQSVLLQIKDDTISLLEEDNNKSKKEYFKKVAEYEMIFDLIKKMAFITDINLVVKNIKEISTILFAPERVLLTTINSEGEYIFDSKTEEGTDLTEIRKDLDFKGNIRLFSDKGSFIIKIKFFDKIFGFLSVENLKFKEYLTHYSELSETLSMLFSIYFSSSFALGFMPKM